MNVLVDTSVWSLSLRRSTQTDHPAKHELEDLVRKGRVALIGPIRQEILSGVKTEAQFNLLRNRLRAFTDLALKVEDYEGAARFFNLCRAKGVQGSNTDFLICAVAARGKLPILTTDTDFERFAEILPILLYTY